jgi:hypothetical protein
MSETFKLLAPEFCLRLPKNRFLRFYADEIHCALRMVIFCNRKF